MHWIGVHVSATWWIRLNRPCAAAMRPFVKLFWPVVLFGIARPRGLEPLEVDGRGAFTGVWDGMGRRGGVMVKRDWISFIKPSTRLSTSSTVPVIRAFIAVSYTRNENSNQNSWMILMCKRASFSVSSFACFCEHKSTWVASRRLHHILVHPSQWSI